MIILLLLLGALILWCYFHSLHRDYWIDLTRQRLFTARDALFDAACDGGLPIDSDGYKLMRNTLNGMIRYTHDFSLAGGLLMRATSRFTAINDDGDRYEQAYINAVKQLSPAGRKAIKTARRDMHFALVVHLIHTSILLWIAVVPMINLAKLIRKAERLQAIVAKNRRQWRPIDAAAHCIGTDGHAAHC